MKFEVAQEILDKTKECRSHFACLANDVPMCPVESDIGAICFLKEASPHPCPYKTSFAGKRCCTCPVRNEVYRKYHQ